MYIVKYAFQRNLCTCMQEFSVLWQPLLQNVNMKVRFEQELN